MVSDLVDPLGTDLNQALCYPPVELPSSAEKQRGLGRLLRQCVFVHIGTLGQPTFLTDELASLKIREPAVQRLQSTIDIRECVEIEFPADHRRCLGDPLRLILETVQTGVDHAGEGIADHKLGVEQKADNLFDEEWVPLQAGCR